MQFFWLALAVATLACLVLGSRAQQRRASVRPNEGTHQNRIGDGLRRLNANKRRYAVMTRALLDETPDDELLEAALSSLWARMRPDLSDALDVMADQSPERRGLYALYAVTGGVNQDGMAAFLAGPEAALVPTALALLDAMDMRQSAEALRAALAARDAEVYGAPYLEAFEAEAGKANMIAYIRERPDGFTDPA